MYSFLLPTTYIPAAIFQGVEDGSFLAESGDPWTPIRLHIRIIMSKSHVPIV